MSLLASTGFETGDFTEVSSRNITSGQQTIEAFPHSGVYSARFVTDAVVPWAHSLVSFDVQSMKINVRAWFYIDTVFPPLGRIQLFWIEDAERNILATAEIRDNGDGVPRWYIIARDMDGWVGQYGSPAILNQYISVELEWILDAVNGSVAVYINGSVPDVLIAGLNTSFFGPATAVRVGIGKHELDPAFFGRLYADDIIVSDTFIGPDIPTPPPDVITGISLNAPNQVKPGEIFSVSGKLTSLDTGTPLGGATISLQYNGVAIENIQTDFDGNYLIQTTILETGSFILVASFLGGSGFNPSQASKSLVVSEEIGLTKPVVIIAALTLISEVIKKQK